MPRLHDQRYIVRHAIRVFACVPAIFVLQLDLLSGARSTASAQESELVGRGSAPEDWVGWTLEFDGDLIVAQALQSDFRGEVWTFLRDDAGAWSWWERVEDPDPEDRGYFGTSLAFAGGELLVGAPRATVDGVGNAGEVHRFVMGENDLYQHVGLLPSDNRPFASEQFGASMASNGERVLVGADLDPLATLGGGAVYEFEPVGDGTWTGHAPFVADDIGASQTGLAWSFGSCVSIDGDEALIGASNVSVEADFGGAAYLFEHVADEWVETHKFDVPDLSGGELIGAMCALRGDLAVVAGMLNNNGLRSARALIFSRQDGVWELRHQVGVPHHEDPGRVWMMPVDIVGGLVAIGAPWADRYAGTVELVLVDDRNVRTLPSLTPAERREGEFFGQSLDIHDDQIAVGAPGYSGAAGRILLFDFEYVPPIGLELDKKQMYTDEREMGRFIGRDVDEGDTLNYAVVESTDDLFTTDGDRLVVRDTPTPVGTYVVRGQVTDSSQQSFVEAFTVEVLERPSQPDADTDTTATDVTGSDGTNADGVTTDAGSDGDAGSAGCCSTVRRRPRSDGAAVVGLLVMMLVGWRWGRSRCRRA